MSTKLHFREEQQFKQVWLWLLVGISSVAALLPIIFSDTDLKTRILLVCVAALPLIFIASMKLITEVRDDGIYFRFAPFHTKDRQISWDEIDQVYSRQYRPLAEYGGWGVRYGNRKVGKAFNVSGNQGLQIIFKDGRKLLLGTQSPDEIEAAVMDAMNNQNEIEA